MFNPAALFDLSQTEHRQLFARCEFAWEALKHLADYLSENVKPTLPGDAQGQAVIGPHVFIGAGTVVEAGVVIKGPAIIGKNCKIRHGAYLRENVILGDHCLIGHASEVKHSILFNGCQVSHFNYVGDSILGAKAHLGAGAKISNVKLFPGNVTVEKDGRPLDTGLRKFGALIGDGAEIGCNAVLNPGSVIGRNSVVYPNVTWRSILPENMIAKNQEALTVVKRHPRGAA